MAAAISEDILDILNHALNPVANSAADYVTQSSPYTTDADKATMGAIREAAATDLALANEISNFISDNDGIPRNGLPDSIFAEWNYLSFPVLLELLISKTERDHSTLKKVLEAVQSDARAKELVSKIITSRDAALKKYNELLAKYKSE